MLAPRIALLVLYVSVAACQATYSTPDTAQEKDRVFIVRGTVTNTATGAPINHVLVSLVGQKTSGIYQPQWPF